MALNFPANPVDGQLYPDPAVPGATQYIYNSAKGTWLTVFKGVEKIAAKNPIYLIGTEASPTVAIYEATPTQGGYMTAADKRRLDTLPDVPGTVTSITAGPGLGAPNTGDTIIESGTIRLLTANYTRLGGVIIGEGLFADAQGVVSVTPPVGSKIGAVKAGENITISSDGTISAAGTDEFTVLDTIADQFNGTTRQFGMYVNGIPYSPASIKSLLIFVGGIIQTPLTSYTIVGTNLLFSTAPPAGASFYGLSLS